MDFSKLTDYLNHLLQEGVPGCEMIVWQNHDEIYRHTAGEAKGKRTGFIPSPRCSP